MAVRFKFRSSVAFDSIDLDGRLSISVRDLRSKIADRNKLHICGDFDLVLSDADTGQAFEDEAFQIPAGANVIIKRVPLCREASNDRSVIATYAEKSGGRFVPLPVTRCENFGVDNFDDFGVDVYPNLESPAHGYLDDIDNYNSTVNKEDTTIRFSEESNLRSQTIANALLSEALPKEIAGENFRTDNDKGDNKKEKNSEYNGALKNKFSDDKPFQIIFNTDLPAELRCSLCSSIFEEAVMIPCCQHSFCNRCIALTLVKQSSCPKCSSSKCTVKDLLPNLSLRQAIEHFLEAQNDINGSYNKLPRYAPDGESGIQVKDVSCAVSVQQQEPAACPHSPSATGMGSNHVTSELACENKFPFKRQELCVDTKVGRTVIPPSKHRKFERNCYMCGSPDHLIRECPLSKRENALVSGVVPPYREGYWHGSTFPNVNYGNIYGGPAMLSFDPMMFQVSPFGISSYLPPMYSNPPSPYGFMRMGAVPPLVMAGADAGTYAESMNNQDGQRKHRNEFQERYHEFGLSEDYHSAGTRRLHEQLNQADKETSSDNDESRAHGKYTHHDPHARPSYQAERGYTADVKHKDPHMSACGRDRQTHYSDKSKSDLLDASDGSRRLSAERRSHLSKSSKHSGSDCSWKSHRRRPMSDDDEFATYPRKFHKEHVSSTDARSFRRERDSSHSSRHSSKLVKTRDGRVDDEKWEIVKEREKRERDGRPNQRYRRMP